MLVVNPKQMKNSMMMRMRIRSERLKSQMKMKLQKVLPK